MAIYKGVCVYELDLFEPDVPSKMYILVNAKTEKIVLMEDRLQTFPGIHNIAATRERAPQTGPMEETPKVYGSDRAGMQSVIPKSM